MSDRQRWNTSLYETKHAFVWQYGSELIQLLSPQPKESILDLGCGTGQLTNQLANSGAVVIGIDQSPEMIAKARENYPHIKFQVADGTNFVFNQTFDAIFSNAALHWMKPPEAVIKCIVQALKPGGRLVAEFGGKGNVQQIIAAIETQLKAGNCPPQLHIHPWYFPSIGEYAALLEQQGLEVTYATLFTRPTKLDNGEAGLNNWLKMFTDSWLSLLAPTVKAEIFRQVEKQLKPTLYQDGSWLADYKRLRFVAIKLK